MENDTKPLNKSKEICCICLKKYGFLETIDDTDENQVKHSEKLYICVPDEVWYRIYKICKNCSDNLETAYQLIILCTRTKIKRKQTYKTNKSPYNCSYCKKSFKLEKSLKKHITEQHDVKTSSVITETDNIDNSDIKHESDLLALSNERLEINKVEVDEIKNEVLNENLDKQSNIELSEPICSLTEPIETQYFSDNDKLDDNDVKSDNSLDLDYKDDSIPVKRKKTISSRKTKKEKQTFKCEYCTEEFTTDKILQKHTISKHTFERPFKCDQCDASYRGKDLLTVHKRTHTGETPYVCFVCGKAFKSSHGLFVHNQLHSNEKAYACPLCPKAFKTQAHLRTHRIGVHTKPEELKYVCNICGHKFPFKGHLDKHLVRHSGIKNSPCRICGKMFVSNSDAELHIRRTHQNDKMSPCDVCGKEFKSTDGLHKHLKTAHDIGNYKVPVHEKKLLCPYCPKMFPFNHKLQRHILTHTGEKPFKCNLCPRGFRDKTDFKAHTRNVHHIVEVS